MSTVQPPAALNETASPDDAVADGVYVNMALVNHSVTHRFGPRALPGREPPLEVVALENLPDSDVTRETQKAGGAQRVHPA